MIENPPQGLKDVPLERLTQTFPEALSFREGYKRWVAVYGTPRPTIGQVKKLLHLSHGFSSCIVQLRQKAWNLIRRTLDNGCEGILQQAGYRRP